MYNFSNGSKENNEQLGQDFEVRVNSKHNLKVVSATFLLVCFFKSKTRALVKLGKMFFILLQKLFRFWRKSNFNTLDFQIS